MVRTFATIVTMALIGVVAPEASARAPRPGVYGTINGKTFKATNVEGAGDPCASGIYEAGRDVVFSAIECRPKRRRQGAVRRNYKVLVMACTNFAGSVTPPYEIPCAGSGYSETKTGRFGVPISTTQWSANFDFSDINNPTSNVRMRVDAVDGTTVRGAIYGVFEIPIQGAASATPAAISGEVRFDFPFQIQ